MLRKSLLACGVLASLVYVGADVLAAIRYPAYHSFASRAVSELMARGAPTEKLVDPIFLLYDVLMVAFAVGLWMSSSGRRARATAGILFAYAVLGFLGPTIFEMSVRGAGTPASDVPHIALTGVMVILIFAATAVGASMVGRRFRLYSFATQLVMLVFGVATSFAARALAAGAPTPWFGITERIDIGAFLLWVAVLAVSLLRSGPATNPNAIQPPAIGPRPWPAAHER